METRMFCWGLGLTWWNHITNEKIRVPIGVTPVVKKMRKSREGWFERRLSLQVQWTAIPREATETMVWSNQVDMKEATVILDDTLDSRK